MVKTVISMSMGPLSYFYCCKVSFLIRSNAVWNTIMVGEAFCKCTDGCFGRSIVCRSGKSIPRISVYSNKNRTYPFHNKSDPMESPCCQVAGRSTQAVVPYQGLSVGLCLLADWAFNNGHCQVGLGVEVHVAEPLHNLYSCHQSHFGR